MEEMMSTDSKPENQKKTETCPVCGGSGSVPMHVPESFPFDSQFYKLRSPPRHPCYHCGGKGKLPIEKKKEN